MGLARNAVAEWFTAGQAAELAEDVRLLVSELATNCVIHAVSSFRLSARMDKGCARVEVSDDGGGVPAVQTPGLIDIGGRGLTIVASLATRWGVQQHRGPEDGEAQPGKTVWFEFDRAP